jgi:hypothetical protein
MFFNNPIPKSKSIETQLSPRLFIFNHGKYILQKIKKKKGIKDEKLDLKEIL